MTKKGHNKKKRYNTTLQQHKREGKCLAPPLMTLPNMKLTYWLKDDFPDMLWLVMLTVKYKDEGMVIARQIFDVFEEHLIVEYGDLDAVPKEVWVNGRLTSFDSVPEKLRKSIIQTLKARYLYESAFPEELDIILSKYSGAPGAWLWHRDAPKEPYDDQDKADAEELLRHTIESGWTGTAQSSTWAKIGVTSAMFSSGRVSVTKPIADEWAGLLPRYPHKLNDDERKRVESSMRAFYQCSLMRFGDEGPCKSIEWSKEFWRENWELYDCEGINGSQEESDEKDVEKKIRGYQKHLNESVEAIRNDFLKVADTTDPDLYDPTRYEVLTGIVSRVIRAVDVVAQDPNMWSTEHGSGLIRGLVEARIVFAWLALRDEAELFEKFKAYGRGHLKLLKLHLEEFADKQEEPNPELVEYIKILDDEVNWDVSEEFQDIRLDANFAGNTNSRKMADEVGLGDEYRFMFAPASSAFHGEWNAIDQFAMVVCANPMHRGHRRVRKDVEVTVGPQLMQLAIDQLEDVVRRYKEVMSADETKSSS